MKRTCLVILIVVIVSHSSLSLFRGGPCIRDDGLRGSCSSKCKPTCTSTLPNDVCGYRGVKPEDAIGCCIETEKSKYPTLDAICTYHHRNSTGACFDLPTARLTESNSNKAYIHVAAIGWSSLNGIAWKCGGSLISDTHVLTSAHCLVNQFNTPDVVRVGFLQLSQIPEQGDYAVTKVIYHPEYDPSTIYHDMAILQISKRNPLFVSATHSHLPACLWTHEEYKTRDALTHDYHQNSPQSISVEQWQLIDNFECKSKYPVDDFIPNGIDEGQFCAVGRKGGPICDEYPSRTLTVQSSNIPFVVGISAYRRNCVQSTPTAYTRLYPYLAWIEQVLSF